MTCCCKAFQKFERPLTGVAGCGMVFPVLRQLRSAARAPSKRGTMPTTMTWGGGGVDVALGRRASMEVEAGRMLAQHQDEQAALLSSGKKDYSYSDALPGADRCGGGPMASVWKGVM